uniref:Uncharacterized protein n=1 Tax=Anguilla anguilla TaxID=7936 RepID=A0A0E9Q946_ANGAN
MIHVTCRYWVFLSLPNVLAATVNATSVFLVFLRHVSSLFCNCLYSNSQYKSLM